MTPAKSKGLPARKPSAEARLAIDRFRAGNPDAEAVTRFLEAQTTVPIVEGSSVTFLFRGEVSGVYLRHWIFGLQSAQEFRRVENTDLWYLVFELPGNSRVEYKLEVVEGENHRLIEDPLNPNRAHDPFGSNSVVYGLGYETPEWTQPDPEARPGELSDFSFKSAAFGDERAVTLYTPARFRTTRAYPLLVVHDGGDYLRFSRLKTVFDNLIHRLEIPSMVVAFTHPKKRLNEYPDNPAHAKYMVEELVPYLEDRLPLTGTSGSRGLMGASFGGVAAFSTAWRYPGFFGRLLLQSGSFAFSDIGGHKRGPAFDPVVDFVNAYRDNPIKVSNRVFVSCGMYESLIYENRSLIPVLQSTGMEIRYVEARDGHNWENWRDRSREGLSWLFPGPLWMVYE